jgi:predicted phosphodiesterase
MRKFARLLLLRPILWMVRMFSSDPDRKRIFKALSELKDKVEHVPGKKGFVIPFNTVSDRFIIFSDQHKGRKNGADDFMVAEPNYIAALEYYEEQRFHFISLGDSEELWENTVLQVMRHNKPSFEIEQKFATRDAFTKIFGNHDLDWEIDPLAPAYLEQIYKKKIPALEAIMLQTTVADKPLSILCTHGHQGDLQSDGNWFSKFFVSKIWAPLQSWLRINPNTPAYDTELKTLHNIIMYEWSSAQNNLLLITGHTHQPVFESLTHIERLRRTQKQALYQNNPEWAQALEDEILWRGKQNDVVSPNYLKMKPTYFNSGCCCYSDGDITGIEIADGSIRLVEWKRVEGKSVRYVLEEALLENISRELQSDNTPS